MFRPVLTLAEYPRPLAWRAPTALKPRPRSRHVLCLPPICIALTLLPLQALLLVDDDGSITVVQPNEDGSFWRKIVRNKMIRMKEKRRVQAAKAFGAETISSTDDYDGKVVSSWGPCELLPMCRRL